MPYAVAKINWHTGYGKMVAGSQDNRRISAVCASSIVRLLPAGILLIRYSSLRASLRVNAQLVANSVTGKRDRVYLAPFPRLWSASRLPTSVLIPQYSDLSAHSTR
jgi:hypothetical protein